MNSKNFAENLRLPEVQECKIVYRQKGASEQKFLCIKTPVKVMSCNCFSNEILHVFSVLERFVEEEGGL